jgi:hypothetical protein
VKAVIRDRFRREPESSGENLQKSNGIAETCILTAVKKSRSMICPDHRSLIEAYNPKTVRI